MVKWYIYLGAVQVVFDVHQYFLHGVAFCYSSGFQRQQQPEIYCNFLTLKDLPVRFNKSVEIKLKNLQMLCLILMNDAFNSFMFTSYTFIYIHIYSIGLFLRKFQAWSIVFYNVNAILSKLHIICFYRKHLRKLVGKSRIFIGNSNTTNSLFTRSASLLHMA